MERHRGETAAELQATATGAQGVSDFGVWDFFLDVGFRNCVRSGCLWFRFLTSIFLFRVWVWGLEFKVLGINTGLNGPIGSDAQTPRHEGPVK